MDSTLSNRALLLELATGLVTALKTNDSDETQCILEKLTIERELSVFSEIGKLTRALHSALLNVQQVNVNLDGRLAGMAEREIPEARERLSYVISKTEQAAHRTLGAIEELLPIADNIRLNVERLLEDCSGLGLTKPQRQVPGSVSESVETFFKNLKSDSEIIHTKLSEVLIAQDYQDLTGQVIRRVIEVFQEVEKKLVELVSDLGKHRRVRVPTGSHAKGDNRDPGRSPDENRVANQDEVDNLLSSLGF